MMIQQLAIFQIVSTGCFHPYRLKDFDFKLHAFCTCLRIINDL